MAKLTAELRVVFAGEAADGVARDQQDHAISAERLGRGEGEVLGRRRRVGHAARAQRQVLCQNPDFSRRIDQVEAVVAGGARRHVEAEISTDPYRHGNAGTKLMANGWSAGVYRTPGRSGGGGGGQLAQAENMERSPTLSVRCNFLDICCATPMLQIKLGPPGTVDTPNATTDKRVLAQRVATAQRKLADAAPAGPHRPLEPL